ncbi:MAG TPA: hypothetical protein VLX29_07930 [Nitrospirota bacterium]|nr:hypothetical protein [Nitrospirota bacterium]
MLETIVLIFAMVSFFLSFLIRRANDFVMKKIATSLTLIAWGSLVCGLFLTIEFH